MNRLTFRLLIAFAIVLMTTLAFSTFALLVVLRARPIDLEKEFNELAATALDLNYREAINYVREIRVNNSTEQTTDDVRIFAFAGYLNEQSVAFNARVLVLAEGKRVLFDTGDNADTTLRVTRRDTFLNTDSNRPIENILSKGFFEDADGKQWYFVEQPFPFNFSAVPNVVNIRPNQGQNDFLPPPNNPNQNIEDGQPNNNPRPNVSILIARPVPKQTFRSIIRDTSGSGLFLSTVQAGAIGMVFAFFIALWIVRWISKPLLNIAEGAAHIADGDYSVRVPVVGPDETKVLAQSFNYMVERVELSQQTQRDFLANVSHDLRTPLTSIQGFAQAISEGVGDTKLADIIYNEASRLNRMVNDLLDLARIQDGRMDMMRQSVELDTLLNNVGRSMSMKANQGQVKLKLDIPKLPRIAGDGDRLAQVFTNLVDNAIKHTAPDGNVWFSAEIDNQRSGILIHIQDTGEGIPKEDLPRIFERFYQVDKSRAKSSGTGLGLAITFEIVKAHAGSIWVESELGKGTRFSVWLPQPMADMGKTVMTARPLPA